MSHFSDNSSALIWVCSRDAKKQLLAAVKVRQSHVHLQPAENDIDSNTLKDELEYALVYMACVCKRLYEQSPHSGSHIPGHTAAIAAGNSHAMQRNDHMSQQDREEDPLLGLAIRSKVVQEAFPEYNLSPGLAHVMQQFTPEVEEPTIDNVDARLDQFMTDATQLGDRCFLCAVPWLHSSPPIFALCEVDRENPTPKTLMLTCDIEKLLDAFSGLKVDAARTSMHALQLKQPLHGSATHGRLAP